ncbi:hypothetical protein OXYTRIMIC_006 [Oxytricha trifallax]|uniref:Uncharacterized protein n=1 Tax=Oxytricha trifallax TaxID=1172189 RepID=A0A073HZF5_9SPIT|nr:hypothetical protein OXYTRIMIC_006 [Oxytricha trifallax]
MWTIASKFIEADAFMIYKGYRQVSYIFNLMFLELLILLYGQKKANINIMLTEWVTIQDITRRYACLDQKDPPHHLLSNISQQLKQLNLYQAKIQKKPNELDDIMKAVTQGGYICKIFKRDQNDCEDCVLVGNELTIEK